MFMEPESYVALDGRHMRPILGALIGVARDGRSPGDIRSQLQVYVRFLDICHDIRQQVIAPLPIHDSVAYPNFPEDSERRWVLADIQQAIFQFTKEGNAIIPCCDTCPGIPEPTEPA